MVNLKIIDRAINKTIWENNDERTFPIPRIEEHIIIKGIIYQVGDVVHDGDNNIITIKVWREGTVR